MEDYEPFFGTVLGFHELGADLNILSDMPDDPVGLLLLMPIMTMLPAYFAFMLGGYTTTFLYDLLIKGPVKGIKKLKNLIMYGTQSRENLVKKRDQLIDKLKKHGFTIEYSERPVHYGYDDDGQRRGEHRYSYNGKVVYSDNNNSWTRWSDITESSLKGSWGSRYILDNLKKSKNLRGVVKAIKQIDILNLYITKYNEKLQDNNGKDM